MSHRPGNHRDQRRLIDIAPSEMTAAGQEVQLVTQVPIPVSRVQMHHQLARGNQEYNRGRAQHRNQVLFVTAYYRATRHLRLRLRHHSRLLQIASVAILRLFSGKRTGALPSPPGFNALMTFQDRICQKWIGVSAKIRKIATAFGVEIGTVLRGASEGSCQWRLLDCSLWHE